MAHSFGSLARVRKIPESCCTNPASMLYSCLTRLPSPWGVLLKLPRGGSMPRKSLLLALSFCVLCSVMAQAAPRDIIPAGTLLQCTLDEPNFSSKTAMVGDPVLCHLGPLGSFGHSVFPRGAMLGGHLQDSKDPGRFVRS